MTTKFHTIRFWSWTYQLINVQYLLFPGYADNHYSDDAAKDYEAGDRYQGSLWHVQVNNRSRYINRLHVLHSKLTE